MLLVIKICVCNYRNNIDRVLGSQINKILIKNTHSVFLEINYFRRLSQLVRIFWIIATNRSLYHPLRLILKIAVKTRNLQCIKFSLLLQGVQFYANSVPIESFLCTSKHNYDGLEWIGNPGNYRCLAGLHEKRRRTISLKSTFLMASFGSDHNVRLTRLWRWTENEKGVSECEESK